MYVYIYICKCIYTYTYVICILRCIYVHVYEYVYIKVSFRKATKLQGVGLGVEFLWAVLGVASCWGLVGVLCFGFLFCFVFLILRGCVRVCVCVLIVWASGLGSFGCFTLAAGVWLRFWCGFRGC